LKPTAPQHAAVVARMEFIRSELGDLSEYRDLDWLAYQRDRKARRNVERIAENVANAAIDVAKILLAASEITVPGTYREVLEATLPAGLADEATSRELVRLAQLRNTLSHRYLDYKWDGVKWFLHSGSAAVLAWLTACEHAIEARDAPEPPRGHPGS